MVLDQIPTHRQDPSMMHRHRHSSSCTTIPRSISNLHLLPLQLLLCCTAIILFLLTPPCHALRFLFSDFRNMSDILVVQEGTWYNGTGRPSVNDSVVWLTAATRPAVGRFDMGRIVYREPVHFSSSASFNTSFVFKIVTAGAYDTCGSGFSFSVASFLQSPSGSFDGLLGLVNTTTTRPANNLRFFAIEFDTLLTDDTAYGKMTNDPSASHIAIDVNSLSSLNITDTSSSGSSSFPNLYLYSNNTFTCWIQYNSSDSLIRVWLTNSSSTIDSASNFLVDSAPVVQTRFDLSTVFLQDLMYLGFTSVNYPLSACSGLGVALYTWSFSSDEEKDDRGGQESGGRSMTSILSISLPVAMGTAGITLLLCCFFRRHAAGKRRQAASATGFEFRPLSLASRSPRTLPECPAGIPQMFSYRELNDATSCFAPENKIGEGSFSSVYKGVLANGSVVAIKRLKEGLRKEAELTAEMSVINNIRHRSLLQLQGWCYQKGEALLVYEYMSNGSLHDFLFKKGSKAAGLLSDLDAVQIGNIKMRILLDVAAAMEYLHGGLGRCVLHRDIKAANVLLTETFEARLGDFGLARLIDRDDDGATLTAVGTAGYVAPEVFSMRKISDKSDVYSFGVLMAVVACGRKALEVPQISTGRHHGDGAGVENLLYPACLVEWLANLDLRDDRLHQAVDAAMAVEQTQKWTEILKLALLCCGSVPSARPNMRQLHQMLRDIVFSGEI